MITVVPEGGLCNRLRVVASASVLAQACGQPMQVLWYRTPDFNSRFDALFDTAALHCSVFERDAMHRLAKAASRARELAAHVAGAVVLGPSQTDPNTFDFEATTRQLNHRDVYIRSNSRLVDRAQMFKPFVPIGEAATRIATMRSRLASSVGVHVRRTDNTKAAAESTLQRFIELMHEELEARPDTQYFVATDDPAVMQAMRAEFGHRLWEHPKRAYARNDPIALVDAVVDLYGLGGCRKLIGSYWSSFTDTAAALNGIECVIARTGDR